MDREALERVREDVERLHKLTSNTALRTAREDVERLQWLAARLDYLARSASKKIDEIESAEESQVVVRGLVSVGYSVVMAVGTCEEYSRETRSKHG